MKSFEQFKVGNLVKYFDEIRGINEISKITKIDEDKGIYELEILSTKDTMFYHESDDHTKLDHIALCEDTLPKLGFKLKENGDDWNNGVIELILNLEKEDNRKPGLYNAKFSRTYSGYTVKNLEENIIITTLENDELFIFTLHELQNLYSEEIKMSKLDLSKFL